MQEAPEAPQLVGLAQTVVLPRQQPKLLLLQRLQQQRLRLRRVLRLSSLAAISRSPPAADS